MKKFTLFLSALLITMVSMATNYVKVTEAPADWSGEYLLVYEGENSAHVWTGIDAANCNVTATVTNATISGTDFVTITLAPMEGGYSIQVNGGVNEGKYISGTDNDNKLNFGTTAVPNTLAYEEDGVKIVSNTSVMRFNSATNNMRFRYFKSSTYAGQKVVQLYKLADGTSGETPDDGGETPDDGGETPNENELVIPEEAKDWNIPAEAIDVLKAREICADLASGATTGTKYYVMGYVKKIHNKHIDGVTNFGNAQFYMENVKGANSADDFMAYQVYGLNGKKITDPNAVAVGDFVVVYGELTKYQYDATSDPVYETVGKGAAHIWNSTNPLLSGETPDNGGETPDDDGETPANVTFDFTTKEGLEALGIAYPTTDAGNGACSTDLEEGKAYSQNGISLTAKYGSTATRIWLAASGKLDLRHYKGGVLTFAAPASKVITNIVFDGADVSGLTTLVDKAWTGNASTVEIPAAADAKTIKINTITVHVADASSDFVATPAISGETNFLENTTVTITAEEGLEVYYTLDGTDPTKASTKYTAPFELTATTTVKAIAYNGDKASAVVEKKFTKMTILTCAEAVALCTDPATPGQHIIRGYITEMIEAYNDQYKNITFWMADTPDGGQVLQAFRVKPVSDVEQSLKVGDFVEVIGSLILYTKDGVSIPEVNAGGSVKLITAGDTAVDNLTVDQPACKFIENGQLIIIKNGVQYNAQGQVIK